MEEKAAGGELVPPTMVLRACMSAVTCYFNKFVRPRLTKKLSVAYLLTAAAMRHSLQKNAPISGAK